MECVAGFVQKNATMIAQHHQLLSSFLLLSVELLQVRSAHYDTVLARHGGIRKKAVLAVLHSVYT